LRPSFAALFYDLASAPRFPPTVKNANVPYATFVESVDAAQLLDHYNAGKIEIREPHRRLVQNALLEVAAKRRFEPTPTLEQTHTVEIGPR
jgi:hypothetical protein